MATHQAKALRLLDNIKQWQEKRRRNNGKSIVLRVDSCILMVCIIYTTLRLKVKFFWH